MNTGAAGYTFGEEPGLAGPGLVWPTANLQIWISRELAEPKFVEHRPLGGNVRTTPTQ